MARYCFYCGKELGAGERCSCRTAGSSAYRPEFHQQNQAAEGSADRAKPASDTAGPTADPKQSADTTAQAKSANKFKAFWQDKKSAFKTDAAARKQARTARSGGNSFKQGRFNQERLKQGALTGLSGAFTFLHSLFTKPTEVISGARKAGRVRLLVVYLLEAMIFSLLVLTFVRYSNLTRIAMLREPDASAVIIWDPLSTIIRGFSTAIIVSTLRVLISMLIFRFVGRQRLSFETLLRAYLPGTYYEIIVMLLAVFFVAGSGLQALVMLLAAFALRSVVDTLSLKATVQLSEDRLLVQSSIIYIAVFLALALLINFSVPSLANFGVIPASDKQEFVPNLNHYSQHLSTAKESLSV
ncbi:MAG: hypothetical protein EOM03_10130 [Clostridia bacterium]|nr:hypothetical protein [Clostridia bacterium]